MALLHVLSRCRGVLAHGVDHGLRPEASRELDVAEDFARGLGVPFARSVVAIARGGNLHARARDARYASLREAASCAEAAFIATAHHADDRAETVLLRLLRGASPAGLAVLPARAGDLIRPFIRARRSDILAHLARHRIPFALDPSNDDTRFLRARVRRELLPLLAELDRGTVHHLTALADELAPGAPTLPLPRAPRGA